MTPDHAQETALLALGWILGQEDLVGVFMGATGASAEDLRTQAADPVFQGAVLDFLLMDDVWVTGFCDAHGRDYHDPYKARQLLPGGDLPHWT